MVEGLNLINLISLFPPFHHSLDGINSKVNRVIVVELLWRDIVIGRGLNSPMVLASVRKLTLSLLASLLFVVFIVVLSCKRVTKISNP